jgi:hypothetical protein
MRQVTLKPVDCFGNTGLRKGVEALPPSVTALHLPGSFRATRESSAAKGAWRLENACELESQLMPFCLKLCAALDQPGKPCSLVGQVSIVLTALVEAGPEALRAYLGQCAERGGRLRGGGGSGGLELRLTHERWGWAAANPAFLDTVLGAVLPGAAPHVRCLSLDLCTTSGELHPGTTRHLTAPGMAFPLLEQLDLDNFNLTADVADLSRLAAPRFSRVALHPHSWRTVGVGAANGAAPACPLTALAMGLPRPVDAAGRLAGLVISARGRAPPNVEGINSALAAAGRGWVRVS